MAAVAWKVVRPLQPDVGPPKLLWPCLAASELRLVIMHDTTALAANRKISLVLAACD